MDMLENTREELLRNVSLIDSNMYSNLLSCKSKAELKDIFGEISYIINRLQNMPATDGLGTYNAIRDTRTSTYDYFFNNALSMNNEDYAFLKSLEVAIAFENMDDEIEPEMYAAIRGIKSELANCYEVKKAYEQKAYTKTR